jgi:hypothetical protein
MTTQARVTQFSLVRPAVPRLARRVVYCVGVLASAACSDSDPTNLGSEVEIRASVEALRTELALVMDSTRLITGVDTSEATLTVVVEGGARVTVQRALLESVTSRPTDWKIDLGIGRIGEVITLPFRGVGFEVVETAHPFGNTFPLAQPLTATLPYPGRLRFTVQGRTGPEGNVRSPSRAADAIATFTVLGLYPGRVNDVLVEYLSPDDAVRDQMRISVSRDSVPALPEIEVVTSSPSGTEARLYLTAYRTAYRPIVVDQFGDIRWYAVLDALFGLQQARDGTLLFTDTERVFNTTLEGEILRTYDLPARYSSIHHDVFEMKNGDLVLTVDDDNLDTIEDVLVLLDREAGTITRSWDLNVSIPKNYALIQDTVDWLHVNAVAVDERDMSLLVSGQRRGVYKVSWENELVWGLSDPRSFDPSTPLLDAGGEAFWGQHDIRVDEDTDEYYVFDNGLGRSYSGVNPFSRGVRFTVDETAMTATVIDEFGLDMPDYFSPIISGIDYDQAGNVLVNFGSLGFSLEYQDSVNWTGSGPMIKAGVAFGAALVEYDDQGLVTQHLRFSKKLDSGLDPGIYRARYIDLFAAWR